MTDATKNRIREESNLRYAYSHESEARIEAYIAGATAEHNRAEKLVECVEKAIEDMEYVAFNIDGRTIDDLSKEMVESTSHSDTALIVIRDLIEALNNFNN